MSSITLLDVISDFVKIGIPGLIGFLAGISSSIISRNGDIKKLNIQNAEAIRNDERARILEVVELLAEFSSSTFQYAYSHLSEFDYSENDEVKTLHVELMKGYIKNERNLKKAIGLLGFMKLSEIQDMVLEYDQKITDLMNELNRHQRDKYKESFKGLRILEKEIFLKIGVVANKQSI
jgi:hypothetical protein